MQILKTPLTETLKTYLRNHFAALSGLSDWKIPTRPEVLLWAQTSDEGQARAAAEGINEAGIAEATVSRKAGDTSIYIIRCEKINAEALMLTEFTKIEEKITSEAITSTITSTRDIVVNTHSIQKIPHDIFKQIEKTITGQTLVLQCKEHSKYTAIKIRRFPSIALDFNFPVFSISFRLNDKSHEHYFVRGDTALLRWIEEFTQHPIVLTLAEYIMAKHHIEQIDPGIRIIEISDWGTDWDAPEGEEGIYYNEINDPLIIDAFKHRIIPFALELQKKEGGPLRILDIGAGKGRLACKLIHALNEQKIPYLYHFLEPCERQIERARSVLAEFSDNIRFLPMRLDDYSCADKVHCVISSGGPINKCVVTRKNAIKNAQKMKELLLEDGMLIATGFTSIIVKLKHFELEALSTSSPCVIPSRLIKSPFFQNVREVGTFFNQFQRYVLKKTSPVSDAASSKDTPESGAASMKSGVV